MIAVVNVSREEKSVLLKSTSLPVLKGVKQYLYAEGRLQKEGDCRLLPHRQGVTLRPAKGEAFQMPGESLVLYTNFDCPIERHNFWSDKIMMKINMILYC